ncbi:hypothetical protein E0Z10_g6470 [Xylaria hypoxylon]|uniref:Uncharacterized protein n=1 Tax=Xylaria hypoxylon TaxID=37992 RepID=A0A4Z0YV26_9PEZI|nr:hypothetical protein E0Z10_g6470 [Xylaria hypoxylon]
MYIPDVRRRDSVPPGPQSEVPGAEQQQQQQVFPVSHVTAYAPDDSIPNAKRHHYFVAWAIKTIPAVLPLSTASSSSLSKRADNASPNTTTSIVAGILVTAFVIFVGVFLYIYRRSIHIHKQARKRAATTVTEGGHPASPRCHRARTR